MANQWVKVDGKAYDTAFQRLRDGMSSLGELLSPVLGKQVEDAKFQHRCNNCGQNNQMFHPSNGGNPVNAGVGIHGCRRCQSNSKIRQRVIELTRPEHSISTARLMQRHQNNLRKCKWCNQNSSLFTQDQQNSGAGKLGCWRCDRRSHDLIHSFLMHEASLFRATPDDLFAEVAQAVEMVQKAAAHPASPPRNLVYSYTKSGLPLAFAEAMAIDEDNKASILDLWRCTWRKQYEDDDPLILAILDGRLSSTEGEYLHSVRSDHPEMVMECVETTLTYAWCHALLEAGFKGHIDAVEAARYGGEPKIVADINGILSKVKVDMLPPRRTEHIPVPEMDE